MKFGAIVAARTGSRRLPAKALLPLLGMPAIIFLLKRIKEAKLLSEIIFATTTLASDDQLVSIVEAEGIEVFRGDNDDVLGRFIAAAKNRSFDFGVRITGDCPFVNSDTLDYVLDQVKQDINFDLATTKPSYPAGIDYEIYPLSLLESIYAKKDLTVYDREHVTAYIYGHEKEPYKIKRLVVPESIKINQRIFLLDTEVDYSLMTNMLKGTGDFKVRIEDLIESYRTITKSV
ncbi:MAG: acylneuraminate cytidylyltransferase [Candidatus Omnitrophica bacterium]|nr:acylneuraminate cytidylyltransferase [Candidatus Omnitrophota bacterium]